MFAPELCIEIILPSNATQEIAEKTQLYLQQGAKEVWICKSDGKIEIYSHTGKIQKSTLFSQTPEKFGF